MNANKMSKHVGKACAITASALLTASSLAVAITPTQAFAIDETRTFTWANGSPQPEIPQTIIGADGREYRLTSQTPPQQANAGQTTSQQFSKNETRQIGADQLGQVGAIMPSSVGINENGFSGNIPRTGIDTTPIYRTESNIITSTATAYGDTAEAAKAALPQTINRNGRTLTLADSNIEEARKDTAGNVILYKATGTYAVDVPRQVLDHYNVVAHYSGTLTKTVNGGDWTMQATYSAEDMPAEEQPQEEPAENENEINMLPPQDMDGNTINESDIYDDANTADESYEPEPVEQENENRIPIVPIAIAGGVVLLGGIIAGVLVFRKKKKAASMPGIAGAAAIPSAMDLEEDDLEVMPAVPMGPVIIENPQCQLIELIAVDAENADGTPRVDYEQTPKANLEIEPSCVESIPTIVYFPALLEDENGDPIDFVPTEGAEYWIAIDEETVRNVPNKDIIIASDDDKEIFRGSLIELDGELTDQILLDTDYMTAVVNGTADEEDIIDISEELEAYDEIAEEALTMASSKKTSHPESFRLDDDDDFDIEELDIDSAFDDGNDDEDLGADFASALDIFKDDDDEGELEELEFADDDKIDAMFDNASSNSGDPFAAYGFADDDSSNGDNFDSEFEKEMDSFEYDPDLEPDVDEFDFEEDFQEGTVIEPETEVLEDGDVLGSDLDDLDFDDMDDIVDIDDVEVIADESTSKKKDIKDFKDLLNSI